MMAASQIREELPWLFEMAADAFRKISSKDSGALEALENLQRTVLIMSDTPMFRESSYRNRGMSYEIDIMVRSIHDAIERVKDRSVGRISLKKVPEIASEAEGEETE